MSNAEFGVKKDWSADIVSWATAAHFFFFVFLLENESTVLTPRSTATTLGTAAGWLRFQCVSLAHPSRQPPPESVFGRSWNSFGFHDQLNLMKLGSKNSRRRRRIAEEISVSVAVGTLTRTGWHFLIKGRTMNGTKDFFQWPTTFDFPSEWLWQEFG